MSLIIWWTIHIIFLVFFTVKWRNPMNQTMTTSQEEIHKIDDEFYLLVTSKWDGWRRTGTKERGSRGLFWFETRKPSKQLMSGYACVAELRLQKTQHLCGCFLFGTSSTSLRHVIATKRRRRDNEEIMLDNLLCVHSWTRKKTHFAWWRDVIWRHMYE